MKKKAAHSLRLSIPALREAYQTQSLRPVNVVELCLDRIAERGDDSTWITLLDRDAVLRRAIEIEDKVADAGGDSPLPPLYGIPFAVKDCIDLAGVPTTVACPEFSYTPERSATCVRLLIDAGAIPLGKTNLDQFATGLVGTRSPYGVSANPYDSRYIAGGSSSGSAVAVATGLVSFSLTTDAAGSGRVPAAFTGLVGYKPSSGLISKRGVVPACRSVDCVSVLALSAEDAHTVARVTAQFDENDPYSRRSDPLGSMQDLSRPFAFATPKRDQLEFFEDAESRTLFDDAIDALIAQGGQHTEIDFSPFIEAGDLLYDGPWVADRLGGIREFVEGHESALQAVTLQILQQGYRHSAIDAFDALHRLQLLKRKAHQQWADISFLIVPTAPTIYTIDQVLDQPLQLNTNLGHYTRFLNLLDLAGVAIPAGVRDNGIPFGVTVVGKHGTDQQLLEFAKAIHL